MKILKLLTECCVVCSPVPRVPYDEFQQSFIQFTGVIHNIFAVLVFIGYFMANHPQLPSSFQLVTKIRFASSCLSSLILRSIVQDDSRTRRLVINKLALLCDWLANLQGTARRVLKILIKIKPCNSGMGINTFKQVTPTRLNSSVTTKST